MTDNQNGQKSIEHKSTTKVKILSAIAPSYTLYLKIQIRKSNSKYNVKPKEQAQSKYRKIMFCI